MNNEKDSVINNGNILPVIGNKIIINLKSLFDHFGENGSLHNCCIERTLLHDLEYYDLYSGDTGEVICGDDEACEILKVEPSGVLLRNIENSWDFLLTWEEYRIAVSGCIEGGHS